MRFLITAGPTKEAIDPVRYITNRSSGKMGYSLAEAAAHAGHRVLLISGPTSLDVPHGVDFLPVETAQEMYDAVQNQAPYADIAILSAAVADYRPVSVPDRKIKKTGERMILELERTKDILGSMRMEFGFRGILVEVLLIYPDRTDLLEKAAKTHIAHQIVERACRLVRGKGLSS